MSGGTGMNKDNIYKGISFPFRFNAHGRVEKSKLTHDDFSRISESITQIIFTFRMERIMNNEFGMTRNAIFMVIDDITDQAILKHDITQAIELHEPRVLINDCTIYADPEKEGTLIVELDLHVIKFVKDISLQIPFEVNGSGGEF